MMFSIEQIITNQFGRGALISKPLMNTEVEIVNGAWAAGRSNTIVAEMCCSKVLGMVMNYMVLNQYRII